MKIFYKTFPVFLCMMATMLSAQNPVASYPFSGSANDATANANNLAIHGALPAQDRFDVANNAFSFNGKDAYLLGANTGDLNTDLASVSLWVKVNTLPAQGEAYLVSYGGWQERYKISLPGHGKLIWTTNATGISDMDAGDGNELVPGVWTHAVFVHDGAKDLIYLNGVLAAEKAVAGNLNPTGKPIGIGYNSYEGGSFFDGSLDEITIYDGALTAQQVADLYAAQSAGPVFAQGAVAEYDFNGNAWDASEYENHAKGMDVDWTTDRFGFGNSAYKFDGVSSRVTADNSAQLNSDYTSVSFWVNAAELPAQGEVYLLSFGGWQERWKISLPSHGKPVWTTNHEFGCCSDLDVGDGNELKPGQWMHIVAIHDGTKDRLFVNGALANEKDQAGVLNKTSYPLGIGYNPIDNDNYFHGSIDDIVIFNYGLTDQEVADLYAEQSTSGATPTDLVAEFPFTGDLKDASQFGNNGINHGAAPTQDRFGYGGNAYSFSGAESITVENSVQYNSDYTSVSFWVNVKELPGQGEVYLLSYGGWQERWKISLPAHGKPVWTTNHEFGCCSDLDSGDGNALVPGEWTHVVAVHDGTKDKIFINGVLANEKDQAGVLKKTVYPLGIGFNPIDEDNYFIGSIDEVRIYNKGLTDQEVADLYAEQSVPPTINANPVADYPFSGSAKDESAYRNDGWVNGALPGTDRFGRRNHSYTFNGVSAGITAQNSPQLNTPTTTVSFWVNVKELPGQGEVYLMSFGGWQEKWKISLPSHGKPVWTTNHENGCCADTDSGDGNALVPGEWTHVVTVHDGMKDKVFINGVLGNERDVVGALKNTTHPLGIGFDPIDVANYFNGQIDDVQIYDFGMTDQEVADLYAAQSQAPAVTDTEAPTAPLQLAGTVTNTNVSLCWWESMDNVAVASYNVFVDSNIVLNTEDAVAEITDLSPLTKYTFGVTAVDAAGNASLMSTIVLTTGVDATPDTTKPTAPPNLKASVASNSIVFSWDPSTDNTAVAGYVTFVDGLYFDSIPATQLSLYVGNLEASTFYTFEIYAYDLAGNDSDISELTVSTDEPIVTAEDGLVAHYPFDGDANDATPYANHGAIGGNPVFENVGSRPGMAIVFDGDQDSVLVPNGAQLISDFTTVSFWIRVDDQNVEDAEAYVLDFGHWDQRWKISLPQHLKIVWTTNSKNQQFPNAISDMDSGDGNELVKGFWWHVTMVHDGAEDIIYVDGQEANRKPATGTLNSTARPFCMGGNPIEGGQYFIGALDEVKIYAKALTDEEILKLYETGTTGIHRLDPVAAGYVKMLYPNPGYDRMTIEHHFDGSQDLLLRVFDQMGRQVDAFRFDKGEVAAGKIDLNIGQYQAGKYTLNFVLGGHQIGSMPFIKL